VLALLVFVIGRQFAVDAVQRREVLRVRGVECDDVRLQQLPRDLYVLQLLHTCVSTSYVARYTHATTLE
jgi:uncharacterized protein YfaA (DUF2138 family)